VPSNDYEYCPIQTKCVPNQLKEIINIIPCLINNVAVAATYAMRQYDVQRVAIIDFDVHHGNGTADIFKNDDNVMFCSSFQHPFYPFGGLDNQPSHFKPVPLEGGYALSALGRSVVAHVKALVSHPYITV
jgi:acetoin utilization deacetylase AcuC-like enzyme